MLTPERLPRHELIGLSAAVVAAADEGFVGIDGRVVAETTRTLSIESRAGAVRVRQVPKAGTTFEFDLAGTPDATDDVVRVAGDRLEARPARRTETTGDTQWR